MSGSTLIIERHEWRGFKTVGGELGIAKTRGFWTFTYCPFLLSQWIEQRLSAMKKVLKAKEFQGPKHTTRKSQEPK